MFFFLHRMLVVLFWGAVAALLVYLYQFRAALYPGLDLIIALRIPGGLHGRPLGELRGRVVRVFDGQTLQLKPADAPVYNVRLIGIAAPDLSSPNRQEKEWAERSRVHLSDLVLSHEVRVAVTVSNEARVAAGLVFLGPTNVNVAMVGAALANAHRPTMGGLPLQARYALVRAARLASHPPP
jgi:endonuclease YncB( thermonuclease family)